MKAKDAAQESRRYNNILSVMKIIYLTLLVTLLKEVNYSSRLETSD